MVEKGRLFPRQVIVVFLMLLLVSMAIMSVAERAGQGRDGDMEIQGNVTLPEATDCSSRVGEQKIQAKSVG